MTPISTDVHISDQEVEAALREYDLALQSDPRNTEQLRSKPGNVDRMRRDAMREALLMFCAVRSTD